MRLRLNPIVFGTRCFLLLYGDQLPSKANSTQLHPLKCISYKYVFYYLVVISEE